MKRSRKILAGCLVSTLLLVLLLVGLGAVLTDFLVEMLWYNSMGQLKLLLLKVAYKYVVLTVVTLMFFGLMFLNFWMASRYLGVTMWHKDAKVKSVIRGFRTGSLKVYTPLSLLLAIPLSLPLYREWENALLFFYAPDYGASDSLFNLDVTFYLFALPIIILIRERVILTLLLLLVAVALLYAAEMKVLSRERRPLYRGARAHLGLIIFLMFLAQAAGYGVEALMLQYSTANMPLFYGPGYAEIVWGLPILAAAGFFMMLATLSLISVILTRRGTRPLALFTILALAAHFCRGWQMIPNSVNKYLVAPNELDKQEPYIRQTIQSTLTGYQLNGVERRPYASLPVKKPIKDLGESVELENIPLWDNELLVDVFQQLQAIRPYYEFSGVDAARYTVDGNLHQVYLAAREINLEKLPPDTAASWVNRRLKYTHGYGLVMTPAAQSGEQTMQWYIRNMPPQSDVGFEVNEPSIYYGMTALDYVIAPNESHEFHYPGDQEEVNVDYKGDGGVLINSLWRKALFALYFNDRNLFFTQQTHDESRILFRRHIQDRLRILTPFFELDQNPYLVVTGDRLYWIQDAYTTSRWYPNSEPYHGQLNYIRNSIKITVDAYTGKVQYYLAEEDPIAQAYLQMYPGLIKDISEMPPELRSQVRFPKDLFEIQMRMYAIYHQTDPGTYYKGEDRMQFAEIQQQESIIRMRPYYLTLDLIEPDKREFVLLTPLLPVNRDNLRALAVVGCDPENYGRIILYTFPKGSQVFGPPQINALIDQHTDIAESITLWNQEGSEVKRGKMIVLPVDGRIIYIQPLYMEATGTLKIPQLKRVIMSADEKVVMDVSLERAVAKLHALLESSATEVPDAYELPGDDLPETPPGIERPDL